MALFCKSSLADAASCGLTARQIVQDSCWLKRLEFLWSCDDYSAQEPPKPPLLDTQHLEVKRVSALTTQSMESFPEYFETSRLDRFSDWFRAKTAVALCLQLKNFLKKRIKVKALPGQERKLGEDQSSHCQRPMVDDLAHAEQEII